MSLRGLSTLQKPELSLYPFFFRVACSSADLESGRPRAGTRSRFSCVKSHFFIFFLRKPRCRERHQEQHHSRSVVLLVVGYIAAASGEVCSALQRTLRLLSQLPHFVSSATTCTAWECRCRARSPRWPAPGALPSRSLSETSPPLCEPADAPPRLLSACRAPAPRRAASKQRPRLARRVLPRCVPVLASCCIALTVRQRWMERLSAAAPAVGALVSIITVTSGGRGGNL